jgi:hypothetical protein
MVFFFKFYDFILDYLCGTAYSRKRYAATGETFRRISPKPWVYTIAYTQGILGQGMYERSHNPFG